MRCRKVTFGNFRSCGCGRCLIGFVRRRTSWRPPTHRVATVPPLQPLRKVVSRSARLCPVVSWCRTSALHRGARSLIVVPPLANARRDVAAARRVSNCGLCFFNILGVLWGSVIIFVAAIATNNPSKTIAPQWHRALAAITTGKRV